MLKKIIFNLYKFVFFILGIILPKRKNLIVFESFLGKQFSDNPRAIYEYLLKDQSMKSMYWSIEKKSIKNMKKHRIKVVKRFSFKWMFLMNSAEYWVTNSRLPLWIPKPRKTTYIQTWHGTPLKKLGIDIEEVQMPGTNTNMYKENFLNEAKKWDYLISPNLYSTEIFKRAFDFKGEIIESGYPRNDYLYAHNNAEKIIEVKNKLNIAMNKKVILYAPTWRDNQFYSRGNYKFNLKLDLDLMKEKLSGEYIILLRLHYLISEDLDLTPLQGFVYDFTKYEDIRDLYLVSDILITDYSSVFFDFANLKRPMLFYVYDIEEYRDQLRGFYFDFEKLAPGPLVKTTNEIIENVLSIEGRHIEENERLVDFYDKFCYLEDGSASKRVIEEIIRNRS